MILLENLSKVFVLEGHRRVVLDDVTVVFPTRVSVGLLGRNGAGKSTLLSMIAGSTMPTSGRILSDGRISFPVGFAGSFHPDMTGAQNVRFVARIYGVDTDELIDYVADFAELGEQVPTVVRSGTGFRVVLDAEGTMPDHAHAFVGLVVQVGVCDLDTPLERCRIHAEIVILARDLDTACSQIPHRMVGSVVTERQLVRRTTERQCEQLVTEADAESRRSARHDRRNALGSTDNHLRVSRAVGQEHPVGRHRQHILGRCSGRHHVHRRNLGEA